MVWAGKDLKDHLIPSFCRGQMSLGFVFPCRKPHCLTVICQRLEFKGYSLPVLYEIPTDSAHSTREGPGHMGRCLTPPHRASAVGPPVRQRDAITE